MRKYLLLVVLSIFTQLSIVSAQTLFTAPDTVCVRQPVTLNSTIFGAQSYYWGFCSGDIDNAPLGTNMGSTGFNFHTPGNIDITQDVDGLYYGFVVNSETRELLRLNFGTSLSNVPSITNFGSLTDGLPLHPTSLFILYDKTQQSWFIFVSGGYTASESTLGRIDFGHSLSNPRPNVANFGNLNGLFNGPKGVFVAQDANAQWYGYLVNRNSNDLIRLDFSFNISNTPISRNLGNPGGALNTPTDMAGIFDRGEWYFFVTNRASNSIARLDLGRTLDTLTPNGTDLGNFLFRILAPSSVSLNRDCGKIYAYITDSSTSQLISLDMPTAAGPYNSIDYSVIGGMNFPSGISSIIRDHNNLFAFVTNVKDSSLTRININECFNSSIRSFSEVTPPVYYYDAPGLYNVYYVIDQGLPTMQVECKEIRVLPVPPIAININPVICKGDTIKLYAISNTANHIIWQSNYNADTTYRFMDSIRVWPDYSYDYHVELTYANGCIIDTNIFLKVIKVIADAGPDRTISDGAATTLGGPNTTLGFGYTYTWSPVTYLSTTADPFVVATPPIDYTYTLEVALATDGLNCRATDTVVVSINCGDFNLPNAFVPSSKNSATNKFGILNQQVAQLNYFRIFDRWGNTVFETTSPTQMWDGTYNGKEAMVGVYTWIADGFCTSGKPIKKHGNVTLLR